MPPSPTEPHLTVFLSLQVRIGNMDGVFVAYHNTARLFGFQYIPLEEMEARLYSDPKAGDRVFDKCLRLLEILYSEIVAPFPKQVCRHLPSSS